MLTYSEYLARNPREPISREFFDCIVQELDNINSLRATCDKRAAQIKKYLELE